MPQPELAAVQTLVRKGLARLRRGAGIAVQESRRAAAATLAWLARLLAREPGNHERNDAMLPKIKSAASLVTAPPAINVDRQILSALVRTVVPHWRARRALHREPEQLRSTRIALRHLDQAWGMLEALGLSVRDDFEGQPYDTGDGLVVPFTFEDRDDCADERIVEITEPAIFFHGQLVQKCKAVIGRPPRAQSIAPTAGNEQAGKGLDGAERGEPSQDDTPSEEYGKDQAGTSSSGPAVLEPDGRDVGPRLTVGNEAANDTPSVGQRPKGNKRRDRAPPKRPKGGTA